MENTLRGSAVMLPLLSSPLSASRGRGRSYREVRVIMGTLVDIQVPLAGDDKDPSGAVRAAFEAIHRLDRLMSVYRPESEISHLNRHAGRGFSPVSDETYSLLKEAVRISALTEGCFDVTAGPLVSLWGFHREGVPGPIPDFTDIEEAKSHLGCRKIRFDEKNRSVALEGGVGVDLGGIAKGLAIDWAIDALRNHGAEDAMVSAGGDLFCLGRPSDERSWKIGLKHPTERGGIIAKVTLSNEAVATSGIYENFFAEDGKRWSHLIDPRTGYPVQNSLLSVTVIASRCWLADALATAFAVAGREKAEMWIETFADVEALFIEQVNGSLRISVTKGLKSRFGESSHERV